MRKQGIVYPSISKPIYLQLKEILQNQIESGDLAPGDEIPSERALSESYEISRVTVRKCLLELVQEGFLVRSQGRKTVVARRKVDHHLGRLIGSVEEFLLKDREATRIEVVSKGFVRGSGSVRRQLKLEESEDLRVYEFTRAIVNKGLPVAINFSFVPYDIGVLVDSLDLATANVFSSMESSGYSLSYGEQEITSALCGEDVAGLIRYPVGQPVLIIRRTDYLENGYPILYEKTVYRGDLYQYSIRLQRKL